MLPNFTEKIVYPEKWVYGEKVPFQESNTLEYKEVSVFSGLFRHKSLGSSGLPKYRETIIGFLNGGHGYLIMGIKNDGTILGVENTSDEMVDKLKLWIDSSFNNLVYKNGKPIDPSNISINLKMFPVIGHPTEGSIAIIEAENKGKIMDIMTRSGTIIYRLNASNFRVCSEPVYRKRDVKGMIHSVQTRLQMVIDEKRKIIEKLQEKHNDEVKEILKGQAKETRAYIEQISQSLYEKYNDYKQEDASLCSKLTKYIISLFQ